MWSSQEMSRSVMQSSGGRCVCDLARSREARSVYLIMAYRDFPGVQLSVYSCWIRPSGHISRKHAVPAIIRLLRPCDGIHPSRAIVRQCLSQVVPACRFVKQDDNRTNDSATGCSVEPFLHLESPMNLTESIPGATCPTISTSSSKSR